MGNHDLSISPDEVDVTDRVPFEPLEALAPERAAEGTRTKLGSVPPPLPDEAIASRAWLAKLESLVHEPPPPLTIAPTRARATLPPPSQARIALPPPMPGMPPSVPATGSSPVIAAPVPAPARPTAEGSVATPLPVLFTTSAAPMLFPQPEPPVTLPPADAELDSRILSKEWLLSTEHLALQPRHALLKRALAATCIAIAAGAIGYFVARGPAPTAPAKAPIAAAATAPASATGTAAATGTASGTATDTDTDTESDSGTATAPAPTAAPVLPHPAAQTHHTPAPRVAAATSSTGLLMVATKPPCSIFVDGRATHLVTPQRALHLPAGDHVIAFVDEHHALRGRVAVHVEPHHATKLIRDFMH